jgi:hypothetical protein
VLRLLEEELPWGSSDTFSCSGENSLGALAAAIGARLTVDMRGEEAQESLSTGPNWGEASREAENFRLTGLARPKDCESGGGNGPDNDDASRCASHAFSESSRGELESIEADAGNRADSLEDELLCPDLLPPCSKSGILSKSPPPDAGTDDERSDPIVFALRRSVFWIMVEARAAGPLATDVVGETEGIELPAEKLLRPLL